MTAPVPASSPQPVPYRSKTLAAWLALLAGGLGLHRLYLYGTQDLWAWLHSAPTAAGLWGAYRLAHYGVDDRLAWMLLPVLGLMLASTSLMAILYGLMPDERWNARFNATSTTQHHTNWTTIVAVVVALLVGATALMATIAFGGQHFFEYQAEQAP